MVSRLIPHRSSNILLCSYFCPSSVDSLLCSYSCPSSVNSYCVLIPVCLPSIPRIVLLLMTFLVPSLIVGYRPTGVITNVPKEKVKWIHKGMWIWGRQKTEGDNKKGGRGFTYSCHRVSVYKCSSGHTWSLGRGHTWHPRGISSYINRKGCNCVDGSMTSWSHSEGITQDTPKLCHHEKQGETATICSNIKGVVWYTMHKATIIQEVGEGTWGILLNSVIIFPGLIYGEIWFWANFKISLALAQHSQDKNTNRDHCLTPILLHYCKSDTAFYLWRQQ